MGFWQWLILAWVVASVLLGFILGATLFRRPERPDPPTAPGDGDWIQMR